MSTELLAPVIDESQRVRARCRRGKWFFAGFAIAIAATVLLGFSRTYYLKELFAAPSLPALFHIHGALFTVWVSLFIVQAVLIARARTTVHRKLGVVGGLLVLPMLVNGLMVAIVAAKGEGPVSAAVARGEFTFALLDMPPLVGPESRRFRSQNATLDN